MKKIVLILASLLILVGCGVKNIEVQLSPEQRMDYEAKLKLYTDKLTNFTPASDAIDKRPSMDLFIEKARFEEYLGRLADAEKTLKEGLKVYEISSVAWGNLANIYAKAGEYSKALDYYKLIVDTFPELHQYTIQMVEMYIKMEQGDEALKLYSSYKVMTGFQDPDLYKRIKNIK